MSEPLIYFCGVWPGSRAGHYCHPHEGPVTPWGIAHERYPLLDWHPARDGMRAPRREFDPFFWRQPQDEGAFTHLVLDGWTLLAAWDRSEDTRGGCTSSFAIQGEHGSKEALALARGRFPAVFARIERHLGRPVEVSP